MLSVTSPVNSAATEVSKWGNSGFANSDRGVYPDQLNSVSENYVHMLPWNEHKQFSTFCPLICLFLSGL